MPEAAPANLFGEIAPADETATLFADVVFDRPLDHAYCYGVPDSLRERVGVGKRVLAILQAEAKPVEIHELARKGRCTNVPIRGLIDRGLARRKLGRIENPIANEEDEVKPRDESASPESLTLTPDQLQVWAVLE